MVMSEGMKNRIVRKNALEFIIIVGGRVHFQRYFVLFPLTLLLIKKYAVKNKITDCPYVQFLAL